MGTRDRTNDSVSLDQGEPPVRDRAPDLDQDGDLVAYFCMEFGLYEGLKLYSGGMGILAGDHIKAASDIGVPLVAVGLLYHQGYFDQTLDAEGQQQHHYTRASFAELPVSPAINVDGKPFRVQVHLPGRPVALNVWKVRAREIDLFLLDSDVPDNDIADREITFQLYGGDRERRITQEIVLGVGGVRALRAMGYRPTVWHSNEGHSAFQILERCRERVAAGQDFDDALEQVAASTVFTTHTPVPAGHDRFSHDRIREYFGELTGELGIEMDRFLALGSNPSDEGSFNMTALALRGSRFHNGVSRIHHDVASRLDSYAWPQVPPVENPMQHVTNGVHAPTFLAPSWADVFTMRLGRSWRERLREPDYWEAVLDLPDELVWNVRTLLKKETLGVVQSRANERFQRNRRGPAAIQRMTRLVHPEQTDVLVITFARRFATYKRPTLVFRDQERLAALLNDPERPVLLLFAGKAHPRDKEGQETIRFIHDMSNRPEFEGKVLLLEGYDLSLAKALLRGSDVWLNNPEYPLEASGTSGQKAGMNGVLNLSVVDGWWAEGYDTRNGWAIFPRVEEQDADGRDAAEADELLGLLENEIVPTYFDRDEDGIPRRWLALVKNSMRSLIPRFNASRMLEDYVARLYGPAAAHGRALAEDSQVSELARWKRCVSEVWPDVELRRVERQGANNGPTPPTRLAASLAGLEPQDVRVECVWGENFDTPDYEVHSRRGYEFREEQDGEDPVFELDLEPGFAAGELARLEYRVRIFPWRPLLAHPFETGLMRWLDD